MSEAYLLVSGDFVRTGGMDHANHELARTLAARGVDVHLVAFRAEADLLERPNVFFHRVPKIGGSYWLSLPLLDRIGRSWASRIAARGGRIIVNGGNCRWGDVNWVHFVHAAHHPSGGSAWKRIKRRLKTARDRSRERAILAESKLVITTADRNKIDLVSNLRLDPGRVEVVTYGIDPDLFRPASLPEKIAARRALDLPEGGPIVAFIGSPGDPRKGFETLLAAWTKLVASGGWDATLAVGGGGPDLAQWRKRIEREGLAARVRFLGFLPGAQTLLAASDALVAPSYYEPYSMAVQEALACGLPAFITASAGIAEEYPPELGHLLLPRADDADDLAARLRRWHADRETYRRAIAPFSDRLRSYTWGTMAEKIIALIEAGKTR